MQRPDALGLRALYAPVANLGVGVGGSLVVLARLGEPFTFLAAAAGIRRSGRVVVMATLGLAVGALAYTLQSPPSRAWPALLNGFAQVLPVSVAEVFVCWAVPSVAVAVWLDRRPVLARLSVLVPGSVLFGLYHIAHSPPFNTVGTILFLTAVGGGTAVFFLLSGDGWGTMLFLNFLALHGVLLALEQSPGTAGVAHIQVPLLALSALTFLVGAVGHARLLRQLDHQRAVTTQRGNVTGHLS